ncbi:hypothetical protein P7K49_012144 [Saguinus oedipus]|uniref:Uncharacterized protein n=1 Tax=Saguinus oedipus TaxID=9490 RepID=A0ABQ9VSP1_SAGOE|nr:hypothetical protein P7K49_012144 [Saguinus oedipus]
MDRGPRPARAAPSFETGAVGFKRGLQRLEVVSRPRGDPVGGAWEGLLPCPFVPVDAAWERTGKGSRGCDRLRAAGFGNTARLHFVIRSGPGSPSKRADPLPPALLGCNR